MFKILHVAETLQGGPASYLNDLIGELHARDPMLDVVIAGPAGQEHHLSLPDVRYVGVVYPGRSPSGLWQFAAGLRQVIRRETPDIIHAHSSFAGAVVRVLRALGQCGCAKIVYCAHGWAFDRKLGIVTGRLFAGVERLLARWTNVIVNISRHDERIALANGLPREKLRLVENAIRLPPAGVPRAIYRDQEPLRVLFVGRLDRQKGADIACHVIAALQERRAVEFTLIGETVVSNDTPLPLPAGCHLRGWLPREEIYNAYRAADVLLMPSRWEGFGLVAVEAMSVGTPVVAARVGGLQDIIEDGHDGWLFAAEDENAALRILARLTAADIRAAGTLASDKARRYYGIERLGAQIGTIYHDLCAAGDNRSSPGG